MFVFLFFFSDILKLLVKTIQSVDLTIIFLFPASRSIFLYIGFLYVDFFVWFFFCFLTLIQQIYCQGFTEGNKSGLWSMCIWFPFGSELYSFELYECLDEFMEDKLSSSTDTFISTPPKKENIFWLTFQYFKNIWK